MGKLIFRRTFEPAYYNRIPKRPIAIIDKRLVIGAAIFGIGWGLVGVCPAPAFVLLGTGNAKGTVFLIAMLLGMGIFEIFESIKK